MMFAHIHSTKEKLYGLFNLHVQLDFTIGGLKKYEEAARILRDVYNQKNIDYKIPGSRIVEDSILEYEGPQDKMKNKHDKEIIEQIMDLTEQNKSEYL